MRVDSDISDLFFNRDHDAARIMNARGHFEGFNAAVLREDAETFLANLDRLGVAVPTVDDLIQDFHARV